MKESVKTGCTIGLVVAVLAGWTGDAWSGAAADRPAGVVPRTTTAQIPRSHLNCGSDEIPIYDGSELRCGKAAEVRPYTYGIAPVGQLIGDIWGLQYQYSIAGGTVNSRTGKGEIVLGLQLTAAITYAYVSPEFIAITIEFGVFGSAPSSFSGVLDATSPGSGIYEGDLNDVFGNTVTFDFPGLQIFH